MTALAVRYALRDMRHGLQGFRIFVICLLLGVCIIASVGLLSAMIDRALKDNARALLGGDVEIYLNYTAMDAEQRAFIEQQGDVSLSMELRTIATRADQFQLVELKSIDGTYPLYGEVVLDPPMPLEQALQNKGIAVEAALLERFEAQVGDTLEIGGQTFTIRAVIDSEPDRIVNTFSFGPRAFIGEDDVAATSLIQPGSLIRYRYRLALPEGADAQTLRDAVEARFPKAGWRIRDFDAAAPQIENILKNLSLFLTLTGLTALIAGSVGIANSVNALVQRKYFTIATLKSIGATNGFVFRYYLSLIMVVTGLTIILALGLALLAAWQGAGLINQFLDLGVVFYTDAGALLIASVYGVLISLTFSLWQLGKIYTIKPSAIFKGKLGLDAAPPVFIQRLNGVLFAGLIAFTLLTSQNIMVSFFYIVSLMITIGIFYVASKGLVRATVRLNPKRFWIRHGLANLHRPGARTMASIVSLGIGVTFLVSISLIDGNIQRSIENIRPEDAPTHFFIDIQPDQRQAFTALLANQGAQDVNLAPMTRGYITKINGVPASEVEIEEDVRWALRGDRGMSEAALLPPETVIVAGEWWEADATGAPQISFDEELARGMGLELGDTITYNVLGRDITATITSLRVVDYQNFRMNFSSIFSPGTLEGLPRSFIGTAVLPSENTLLSALAQELPNISPIAVEEAVKQVSTLSNNLAMAIRLTSLVTIIAAIIVLTGALVAKEEQRVYDIIVLKVLGARKADVIKCYLAEYLTLGVLTAGISLVAGTLIAAVVIAQFSFFDFKLLPHISLLITCTALSIIVVLGLAITLRAFQHKPIAYLRNE